MEKENSYTLNNNKTGEFTLSQEEFDLLVRVTYREANRLFNTPVEEGNPLGRVMKNMFDKEAQTLMFINEKLYNIDKSRTEG